MKNVLRLLIIVFAISITSCSKSDEGNKNVLPGVYVKDSSTMGRYLVDEKGMSLYYFTKDIMGDSKCTEGCLDLWPIYYNANPVIGSGLNDEEFATITRADGSMQNTYKGWPLYYFVNDVEADDTNGDAVKGVWYIAKPDYGVMLADGQLVGDDGKNYMSDYKEGEGMTQFMVNMDGVTVYSWVVDRENENNFTKPDFSNDKVWPIADLNLMDMSLPSSIDMADFGEIDVYGKKQTTYKGWPLYYYGKDNGERGITKGVSFPSPGIWPIVNTTIADAVPPTPTEIAQAYYAGSLKPIIDTRCTTCHAGYHNQSNESDYSTFDHAMARAGGLYNQVNSGGMPKGGVKLSQAEIDIFKKFSDLVSDIN